MQWCYIYQEQHADESKYAKIQQFFDVSIIPDAPWKGSHGRAINETIANYVS